LVFWNYFIIFVTEEKVGNSMQSVIDKPQEEEMHQPIKSKDIESLVKDQVMSILGKPEKFEFITAGNVFANNWRVNVWCKHDIEGLLMASRSIRIEHSYFISVDNNGKIISSSPEISDG
tara:strand:+ start:1774 stop:2130 length:357 start_codon:yes stop_codon:yes gene_type:complete